MPRTVHFLTWFIVVAFPLWNSSATRAGSTLTEEEVVTFCRENLAPYKTPRVVRFQSEPLPQSGAGKIQKREIKDALLASMAEE